MFTSLPMKSKLKSLLPARLYNWIMLSLPWLQHFSIVNYESALHPVGLQELLGLLGRVATLEGDIIECGTYRCGTSLLMAKYVRSLGGQKLVYALDSYEGFKPEELEAERRLGLAAPRAARAFESTTYDYVCQKISKLGFEDVVVPVKGFFEQTLPGLVANRRFCFAFIDCDLKDSMTYCAETLWPALSPGGIIAFDDYGSERYKGVGIAVDGFTSSQRNAVDHGLLRQLYYVRKRGLGDAQFEPPFGF